MVMLSTLTLHLHNNNRLVMEQCNLRTGMSIQKDVFKLIGSVFRCINQKRHVEEFTAIRSSVLTV